jgi:hypothetical protein
MTLIKLGDGRIVIHSPIALGESDMSDIERWGDPPSASFPTNDIAWTRRPFDSATLQ